MAGSARPPAGRPRNGRTLGVLLVVLAGMIVLSFASVPLYRRFCQVTGYDGTTQRAAAAPGAVAGRLYTVRFNADIAPGMPWKFEPEQASVQVHAGEQTLIAYRATNTSDHAITGTATFNVTPLSAGVYFDKIQCFCFTEQTLKPGETAEMPVTFFVDPAIAKDKDTAEIETLTLSYTFFPKQKPQTKPADTAALATRGS